MRELIPLRGALAVLLLFAAVMLALRALVAAGYAELLVPTPEGTAEQFVRALDAHRYSGARDLLSEEVRRTVGEADLRALVLAVERAQQGIGEAHGRSAREAEETATATVDVRMDSGREQAIEIPLRKENGIWKITATDPVRRLAES